MNIIWVLGSVVLIRSSSMPTMLCPGWFSYNPYYLTGKFSNNSAILLLFICILHWFFFFFLRWYLLKMCSAFGDLKICTSFSAQDWQWHRSKYLQKIQISKSMNCDRGFSPPPYFLGRFFWIEKKKKSAFLQGYFWLPPLPVMFINYRKWATIFLSSTSWCFLCMLYGISVSGSRNWGTGGNERPYDCI